MNFKIKIQKPKASMCSFNKKKQTNKTILKKKRPIHMIAVLLKQYAYTRKQSRIKS